MHNGSHDQQKKYIIWNVKSKLINITLAWDKEKNLTSRQESNQWNPEHRAGALSTELRKVMESKVI